MDSSEEEAEERTEVAETPEREQRAGVEVTPEKPKTTRKINLESSPAKEAEAKG